MAGLLLQLIAARLEAKQFLSLTYLYKGFFTHTTATLENYKLTSEGMN